MAWSFDEVNDYVKIDDNAALTLPDGDCTIAFWMQTPDNTGTAFQYIIHAGTPSANPSFAIYITEASQGDIPTQNELRSNIRDGDTGFIGADSTNDYFASGQGHYDVWTHVTFVRSGGGSSACTLTLYINGSSVGTATDNTIDACDTTTGLYIGSRSDLDANRFFGGKLAELGKWSRALSGTEITNLANTTLAYPPYYYGTNLDYYVPMYSGDYSEKIASLTVTNNGSTGATHPPVAYPLSAPLITNTPTFYAPTLVKSPYPLTAPLLTNTPTFYGPTLSTSAQNLAMPLLTNSPTFYGPTLVKSTYPLTAPLLSNAPTFYGPTLAATYRLTAPLLTNSPTLHAPTLVKSAYPLAAPLLTNNPTFYGPTFVPGSVSVTTPLLTNTPTFYGPTLTKSPYNLAAPLLSNAPSFYGPTLLQAGLQTAIAPLLTIGQTFYGPTMYHKWTDVNNLTAGVWTDSDMPFTEI